MIQKYYMLTAALSLLLLYSSNLADAFVVTIPTRLKTCRSQQQQQQRQNQPLHLTTLSTPNDALLQPSVFDTIQSGGIAVIPNFLPPEGVQSLRTDAQSLWTSSKFSTDALASYGTNGKFDPTKDRAVLRLNQWKNTNNGNWDTRQKFGKLMAGVRTELSYNLNRPALDVVDSASTTMYGNGSTEISYTRFGPGAFLKRHVDEHHEELKGKDGWSKPTRRSISWLVYLNDDDWNAKRDGGQLRCFQRRDGLHGRLGAMPNGDLQIGWLRASVLDPTERPVYLDGRKHDHGNCAMYMVLDSGKVEYITKDFETNPILYVAGGEQLAKKLLMKKDRLDIAERFHFIEPPKSKLGDILKGGKSDYAGEGEDAEYDEVLNDVEPIGGTLVMFDSVSLPHEVLATQGRERWATSGWFHEDQQRVKV